MPRAFLLAALILSAKRVTGDEHAGWRYWKVMRLDTTLGGADVGSDVRGFPVPVVLGAGFDFRQAKPDGADVRFSRTVDGEAVPTRSNTGTPPGARGELDLGGLARGPRATTESQFPAQ